jgi:MFS transporter, AAHS family, 4-hydroxybenzoate transporter
MPDASHDVLKVDDSAPQRRELLVAVLCGLVLIFEGYDLAAMGYVVPFLSRVWHVRPVTFTPALTAGSVGLFLGSLLCGWLGDRVGRKVVLVGCVASFGIMSLLTAAVDTEFWLALARLGTGFGLGGGIPSAITLLSDVSRPKRQGALVIGMTCGVTLGNTLGGLGASRLIGPYGWRSVFVLGGLAPLLVLPLILFLLPESPQFLQRRRSSTSSGDKSKAKKNPIAGLFRSEFAGLTLLLWAINFLSLLTIYFASAWLPSMLNSLGASPQRAVLTTTIYYLGGTATAVITGAIVGRFGVERVFVLIWLLGATCALLIGTEAASPLLVTVLAFASGIGIAGGQLGINSLPGSLYPAEIRSTGTGWALGVGRLGNVFGPLAGGLFLGLNWSPQRMFSALSGFAFAVAVLLLLLAWLRPKNFSFDRGS